MYIGDFNSHPSVSLLLSPNHCLCVSTTKIGNPPRNENGATQGDEVSLFWKIPFLSKFTSFFALKDQHTRLARQMFFFLLLSLPTRKSLREMVKILRITRRRASIVQLMWRKTKQRSKNEKKIKASDTQRQHTAHKTLEKLYYIISCRFFFVFFEKWKISCIECSICCCSLSLTLPPRAQYYTTPLYLIFFAVFRCFCWSPKTLGSAASVYVFMQHSYIWSKILLSFPFLLLLCLSSLVCI